MQQQKVNVVAKPPLIYLVAIIAGILLQIIWPLSIVSFFGLRVVGLLVIGLGVACSDNGSRVSYYESWRH